MRLILMAEVMVKVSKASGVRVKTQDVNVKVVEVDKEAFGKKEAR